MAKISLKKLIREIKDPWQPRDILHVHQTALRIAKIEGAYDWHAHLKEDEFFLVLKGKIFIDTDKGSIELKEGEGYLVKSGTRHRSRAKRPAWVLLVEPVMTKTKGEET
ncbi:MAG: cupin domain-containing protein [candidate division WOR-3 bacterium]|nr:MAG: cupin domain-containing protein [candidate division WOR-3 bacterium]